VQGILPGAVSAVHGTIAGGQYEHAVTEAMHETGDGHAFFFEGIRLPASGADLVRVRNALREDGIVSRPAPRQRSIVGCDPERVPAQHWG